MEKYLTDQKWNLNFLNETTDLKNDFLSKLQRTGKNRIIENQEWQSDID